tara:strand:- start:1755 stop:3545 length:1791 start_codon:yes stop_codon:yes gene_type:complete
MTEKIFAVDFETYYDKECSIKNLGPLGYFSHPSFDAYMVSVVGNEETEFVGHPKDFDWGKLNGAIVLSHNASFDETLYLYGVSCNWWPECQPEAWHCTADLAAYCKLPRSLKGSTAKLFDLTVDKSTRDNMSGKRWEDMSEEFKEEVSEYALKDSVLCLRLWESLQDKWPESERTISALNRKIVQGGIPIDIELLDKQKEIIALALFNAEEQIPWNGEKPLLSRAAFDEECKKVGLTPPVSLAENDPDSQKWIEDNEGKFSWIRAVKNWRRINSIKKKLESFSLATMPDRRYYGGMMYFGAHTGRFSGGGGNLNLQNLPRGEMFGVNLRHLISPNKGKSLVVVDLSQIEVRTLCWLAKDNEMLEMIKKEEDIYEAFAIRFKLWGNGPSSMGVLKKQNSELRHMVKTMVLGCGYGAGYKRFAQISGIGEKEAKKNVQRYRTSMPSVTKLWSKYNHLIAKAHEANKKIDTDFIVDLPSGRNLNYGKIKNWEDQTGFSSYTCSVPRHGKEMTIRLWGGLISENASQALARDIFTDMMLRVSQAGHKIIMHVHDEMVVETDTEKAQDSLNEIIGIMSTPPEWIPDIPVSAEGAILNKYEK